MEGAVLAANLYEAMFVVDSAKGGPQFPDTIRHIADMLQRYGAQIERMELWEERKFAYPIKKVKRGIYILVYFTAGGSAIAEIRSAVGLSEEVLRVLIVRPEQMSPVKGQLYSPEGTLVEAPPAAVAAVAAVAAAVEPAPAEAQAKEASDDGGDGSEQ